MVKGFNRDSKRIVTFTPSLDCEGALIFANVYDEEGAFVGTVNYVPVDPLQKRVRVDLVNLTDSPQPATVYVFGKNINNGSYLDVAAEESLSVAPGPDEVDMTFNSGMFSAFKVSVDGEVYAEQVRFETVPRDVDPQAVTGVAAEESLSVECNFSGIEAGDEYSIVFEAEGVGVIGRDQLLIFDEDGYLTEQT